MSTDMAGAGQERRWMTAACEMRHETASWHRPFSFRLREHRHTHRHAETSTNRTPTTSQRAKARSPSAAGGGLARPRQSHIPPNGSFVALVAWDLSIERGTCQPGQPLDVVEAPLSHVHTRAPPPAAKPLPALVWSPAILSSRRLPSEPPNTPAKVLAALELAHESGNCGALEACPPRFALYVHLQHG